MNVYSETEFHDDVPIEDADTRERIETLKEKKIKAKGYDPAWTDKLLKWGAERHGRRFSHPMKQKAHLAAMLASGRTPEEIKAKWEELETHTYWSSKGFDFATVANELDKSKKREPANSLLWDK